MKVSSAKSSQFLIMMKKQNVEQQLTKTGNDQAMTGFRLVAFCSYCSSIILLFQWRCRALALHMLDVVQKRHGRDSEKPGLAYVNYSFIVAGIQVGSWHISGMTESITMRILNKYGSRDRLEQSFNISWHPLRTLLHTELSLNWPAHEQFQ